MLPWSCIFWICPVLPNSTLSSTVPAYPPNVHTTLSCPRVPNSPLYQGPPPCQPHCLLSRRKTRGPGEVWTTVNTALCSYCGQCDNCLPRALYDFEAAEDNELTFKVGSERTWEDGEEERSSDGCKRSLSGCKRSLSGCKRSLGSFKRSLGGCKRREAWIVLREAWWL